MGGGAVGGGAVRGGAVRGGRGNQHHIIYQHVRTHPCHHGDGIILHNALR